MTSLGLKEATELVDGGFSCERLDVPASGVTGQQF